MELKIFEMFLSIASFIIFRDPSVDIGLSYQLAEWLKLRQPRGEGFREEALNTRPPNRSDSFWPAILSLLAVGDLYGTVHLLKVHESSHMPSFAGVIELLEAFARLHSDIASLTEEISDTKISSILSPSTGSYRGGSAASRTVLNTLKHSWSSLNDAASTMSNHLQNNSEYFINNLLIVVDVLAGKDSGLAELKPYCDAWYHMLVPRLLYCDPFASTNEVKTPNKQSTVDDVGKHAKWCLGFYFGSTPDLTASDSLFYALLTKDLGQIAKGVGESFSNWWLLAHLLDLLQLASPFLETTGWIVSDDLNSSKGPAKSKISVQTLLELRNYSSIEYALSLANDHDLWPIAAFYLIQCEENFRNDGKGMNNPNGRDVASFLIRRAVCHFSNQETLTTALNVCKSLSLFECYSEICVGEANKTFAIARQLKSSEYELKGCKREWLFAAALSWAARGDFNAGRDTADSIASELLSSSSSKVLADLSKSLHIWESVYSSAVTLLTEASDTGDFPFLELIVRLYKLLKATPEDAVNLLGETCSSVISTGMLLDSKEKQTNLNGLIALEFRTILQNFESQPICNRFTDTFLLSLAKCCRDIANLPQKVVQANELNNLLMIIVRQSTSRC